MDKSTKKLLNGSMVYFVGNALTQLVSLILLRFVTGRISPEEYGIYNLVVTVSNLVIPFVTLQFSDAIFKFFIQSKTDEEKKKYYTITFFVFIFSVIITFLGVFILNLFVDVSYPLYVALYIIFSIVFTLYQRIARSLGKSKVFVAGNLLRTIIYLSLEILFIYAFGLGIEALFLSIILSYAFFMVFSEILIKSLKYLSFKSFEWKTFGTMVKFSLPLVPNAAFWWLTTSVNTLIVSAKCGLDINGIYTVANKFSAVLTMVTTVFLLSWQESAISEYGDPKFKSFFTQTFNMYIKGVFSVIAIMIPFMCVVYPYMIDESYHASIQYAPFLLMASGITTISGYTAQIFTAKSQNHKSLYTNLCGMIANIIIVFTLVERVGLWAAVAGSISADLIIAGVRIILCRKEFDKGIEIFKYILLSIVMTVSYLCYFFGTPIVNIIWFVLCAVVAVYLNYNLIRNILSLVFGRFIKKKEAKS